ncbi:hypothetical protein KY285_004319 [Solanum tuberosum]|nr:hypothetical protein KY289_008698 [Solanum tuberosum]KAH0768448.1 hypothetical protein KY285_004319 [Solanum tuberosum]
MRWHHENKANDGIMRHPVDSKAWKKFDELHQSYVVEPRNVRLGLASDGFQPFGCSRTPYSIWPVVLIPYNLPPWLCMKQENFILSMLIPGPGSLGDAIDVYLQPLIDELKELSETRVCTFDASTKRNFTLHVALLWTINDFPAYGNLSGWSTKGKLACPCCNRETFSKRLTNEWGLPPNTLSGDDILDQVADLDGLPLINDQKKKIKLFIRNRSCVEGSIVEGYIANEFTTLCSRYLHTMETKFNLLERNYDGGAIESDGGLMIFCQPGKALKGGKTQLLDFKKLEQAHIYILKNCDEVQPFLDGTIVAGEIDEEDKTIDYYGELTDILELQFIGGRRLVLFRCMWFDVYDNERGVKMDEYVFAGMWCESFCLVILLMMCERMIMISTIYMIQLIGKEEELIQDDMNPSKFKKSKMGSSSKNFKQSFLPPGALARRRGQRLKSMGSVRVTAEKRNLIDQTDITLETMRSKSEKEIGHNFTSGGSVKESAVRGSVEKRTMVGKNKGLNSETYTQNVVAQKINVVPPGFDALEDETSFPNDDLEVMQENVKSKPAKENGHNITFTCSVKGSNVVQRTSIGKSKKYCVPSSDKNELAHNKNLMQPGFDPTQVDTFFPHDDLEVTGGGNRFTSPSSVRGGIGKRIMIGNNKVIQETVTSKPAKENGHNITCVCSVKGSNVVQRTSIGKSKNYCVPSSDENELAHNKNLMQPGFDPIEVDTFFPRDDLEVMGRGNRFTSLSSVGGGIGKIIMIGNNKGLNSVIYDQNVIPQKTNVVCPDFDAIEGETSFPHDDHEVMQENMRSKPGKENGKNITSVGSARGSTFVQRTSIGESKGYSVVSSDMNVQAHIKIIRQPNFNPIEHATSFPHLKQYKRL